MIPETVPVPGAVSPGRWALRDPPDPAGPPGILELRESPVTEGHQGSTVYKDLLDKRDLEAARAVKERRALRTIPPWGWE